MENSGDSGRDSARDSGELRGELRNSGNSDHPFWRTQGGIQEALGLQVQGKDEASARMWTFNDGMRLVVITNWFSLSY